MSQPDWSPKVGDKVVISPDYARAQDRGIVWEIEKLNPVNHLLRPLNGGRKMRCPTYALQPYTGDTVVESVPLREPFFAGEIVTFKRYAPGHEANEPFVVLVDKGDKVNVAKLGGENDRYFRAHGAGLEKRDLTWLKEYLQA